MQRKRKLQFELGLLNRAAATECDLICSCDFTLREKFWDFLPFNGGALVFSSAFNSWENKVFLKIQDGGPIKIAPILNYFMSKRTLRCSCFTFFYIWFTQTKFKIFRFCSSWENIIFPKIQDGGPMKNAPILIFFIY